MFLFAPENKRSQNHVLFGILKGQWVVFVSAERGFGHDFRRLQLLENPKMKQSHNRRLSESALQFVQELAKMSALVEHDGIIEEGGRSCGDGVRRRSAR